MHCHGRAFAEKYRMYTLESKIRIVLEILRGD